MRDFNPRSMLFPEETTVSERIRAFRTRAGFSQDGLARELGVSEWTVKYWENGRRRPNDRLLVLFTSTVGVSYAERVQLYERIKVERRNQGRHPSGC